MATKWKNKAYLLSWVLLFTFGLGGILTALAQGSEYTKRDYFHTQQFENQLNEFIDALNAFELNYVPPEELKITVTPEDINEHRYRYGDLEAQIANINQQYEPKIKEAQQNESKQLVDFYTAERDKKIADITNNFKSDEYVRPKVVQEKEQKIDAYYRELENRRGDFANLETGFVYYLKDTATGKVYTNTGAANQAEADKLFNSKNMLFVRSYPMAQQGYLNLSMEENLYNLVNESVLDAATVDKERAFAGKIGVSKTATASSMVISNYHDYQQKQNVFIIYTLAALVALIISVYLYKRTDLWSLAGVEKIQPFYNRVPIDISLGVLILFIFFAFVWLANSNPMFLGNYPYSFIRQAIFNLCQSAILVSLTVVQGKLLHSRVNNWSGLPDEWQNSLLVRTYRCIKEAFAIRSIGTQIIIILMLTFIFGLGAALVVAEIKFIIIYVPAMLVIGLPMLIFIVKRAGYFNQIVHYTSELARGNMEPDLPVLGKSALSTLAGNINTLKYGVKTSRTAQVKSERLKTELITNVSHDLRTPLTSIISYTELLKTPDLSAEDREAYVQIIDRKSKRLKELIDDLFEASKMVSGNIELAKERVDLVQLLQQTLAEHDEAISESGLQFRVTIPEKPIYAIVDGQKLWRVFDNLIVNILKYALEGTRVYISLKTDQGQATIVFKNVTKYELGENIEELFERFKRGDTSRHTEGSGLGLAIAKSIVDLHEGRMDIEVDGDLFKITVILTIAD